MKSKILSMIICVGVIALFGLNNAGICASSDESNFKFDEVTGTIISYIGDEESVHLPESINDVTVTNIAEFAFAQTYFKQLYIPKTIEEIHIGAFDMCFGLEEILVSDDNMNFASKAGVLFNKDYTELMYYPSQKSSVHYDIPDGVVSLNRGWVLNGNDYLTTIGLPNTLDISSDNQGTSGSACNMKEIIISEDHPYHTVEDGILYNKDMTILVEVPRFKTIEIFRIPETVTELKHGCFLSKSFVELYIPDGVDRIKDFTLTGFDNLKVLVLPNSIKTLGQHSVSSLTSLESLVLPKDLTVIPKGSLSGNSLLKAIEIPQGVTGLETHTFGWCISLEEVIIPGNVEYIGDHSFYCCAELRKAYIPPSVTEIGKKVFFKPHSEFAIYGAADSYAQQYAKNNAIPFIVVDENRNIVEETPMVTDSPTPTSTPTSKVSTTNIPDETSMESGWQNIYILYILSGIILIAVAAVLVMKKRKH